MVTRISDWDQVEGDLVWENKGSQAMNNEWIVMPNHLHGILLIVEHSSNGVGAYKSTMARLINGLRRTPGAPLWQRNDYEHILRDQSERDAIRLYVRNNPSQWESNQSDY